MEEKIEIKGTVIKINHNKDNHWYIFLISHDGEFTWVKGAVENLEIGETLNVIGIDDSTTKYTNQIKAIKIERLSMQNKTSIKSVEIEGVVTHIKANNNAWYSFFLEQDGKKISVAGIINNLKEGEYVKVIGTESIHPKFGKQIDKAIIKRILKPNDNTINEIELEGKVTYINGRSNNEWYAFTLLQNKIEYNISGNINDLKEGEYVNVIGKEIIHPKYGKQIKATMIRRALPSNIIHFSDYLIKSIVGLGQVTATTIVKAFGSETFEIIANNPEKLAELKGISKRKAKSFSEQFIMLNSSREEQLYFLNLGLTENYIKKIKSIYKENYKTIIDNNPYQLIYDIEGIGFKKADEIAEKLNIAKNSKFRIQSGIIYTMHEISNNNGYVYCPKNILIQNASKLLNLNDELIKNELQDLYNKEELIDDEKRIYLPKLYEMETKLAKTLVNKLYNVYDLDDKDIIIERIKKIEKENKTELDESQRDAVFKAIINNLMVLTGGPGTGKTTTLKIIIKYLEKYKNTSKSIIQIQPDQILLAAPTGRAAKRMKEQTGKDAKTIHKLVGLAPNTDEKNNVFTNSNFENKDINLENAYEIIIDEMSMIDLKLMYDFMKVVNNKTRLLLVGDVDQLPSIGPGSILKDLIKSNVIPVAQLTEIHRNEGNIITNAYNINNGEYIDFKHQNKDFFFAPRSTDEKVINTIKLLVQKSIPKEFKIKPFDVQILAPMRKGILGVTNLNIIMQEFINPPAHDKPEYKVNSDKLFRLYDKVIHTKNNYNIECQWDDDKVTDDGVFNGEIGQIVEINKDDCTIVVKYDDKKAIYEKDDFIELDLAYATTIHKSQGSEYPAIIIPLLTEYVPSLYNRNLLYTAVTRAKNCVALLGDQKIIQKMIDNTTIQIRYTYLQERLKYEYDYLSQ